MDQGIEKFGPDLRILAARPRRHMKRMIGVLKQLQRGALTEPSDHRLQTLQFRELIPRSLQKQHWNLHLGKMFCAFFRSLTRRMKRKPKENEPTHCRQW